MVSAVGFAVRDAAGGHQVGSVAGDGQGNFIQVGAGDSISLNLSAASIIGYEHQGRDLVIKLADGRMIVLAGYFDAEGGGEHLYLSSDGTITEVYLDDDGSGVLMANYGPAQGWDKWSPLDDLRFAEADGVADAAIVSDEPAGMGLFAPALLGGMGGVGAAGAGLLGIGLVGGGGGGGGGGGDAVTVAITDGTESTGDIENLEDYADGVTIAGVATPGTTIRVVIDDNTQDTTAGQDGTWTVTFPPEDVDPGEREVEVTVTATDPNGNTATVTDTLVLDTVPNPITILPVTVDNIVSMSDQSGGFVVGGTTAPGASLVVDVAGNTQTAIAGPDGAWQVDIAAGSFPQGTYEATVTATTVDAAGNTSSTSHGFSVDTETSVAFSAGAIATDNIVNASEAASGVTMTGTSEAGSEVAVTWGGVTRLASSDAVGNWTVTFPQGSVPADGMATATVSATDSVGNTATDQRTVRIDTSTSVALSNPQMGDNAISGAERADGVTFTGTAEAGASLSVSFQGVTQSTVAGANGQWSASFATSEIPAGTYSGSISVTATDQAGNVAATTRTINVDTETGVSIALGQVGGDDVVSGIERSGGVTFSGSAEAGATVAVSFAGLTRTVTADATGQWSATYATAEIPSGTTQSTLSVMSTDALGNTASAQRTISIDTEVTPLTRTSLGAGADEVVNAVEAVGGITVTGTVEAGSTVMVRLGSGALHAATVAANGTWSVDLPESDLPAGETTVGLTVSATDAYGNTRVHSETVQVDRIVRNFGPDTATLAGDGYLNAAEAAQGLTVSGTAEPGATVSIAVQGGATHTVTAAANGTWSSLFQTADLPSGELAANVVVTATDRAGNVASYSQTLLVDTVAPGAPDVLQFQRNTQGLTRIVTDEISETYAFDRIDLNGTVSSINAVRSVDEVFGTQNVSFGQFNGAQFVSTPVPDGSYLVVNSTDPAGNESSTLLIVNNTNAPDVDLGRPGLSGFDFSAIDLSFAPDAEMTISEAQILAMTGADKTLLVKGGADDHVNLVDAEATGATAVIDGQDYTIYSLGASGATVLLDDDITVI